ncbi:MAG: nitroreductase family protein [Candidatus Bathyarchaeota archaeon]|nr:nitroreductase family protein [Candidatus Bathyarchaeota archaeon]
MDVFEAIKTRRSIRKYKSDSIPDEKLKMILEAARLAPSAANRQPWRFVVVCDAERKKALAKASNNQTFLADAAAIVTAISDPDISKRWYAKDPMIAVEHMALTATSLGYGTCWIGAFNEEEVKHLLNIPKGMRVIALLPIGIPDETPQPRPRREISEIFFEEEYGKPLDSR